VKYPPTSATTQKFEERRRTDRIATRTLVEIRVPDWQVLQSVYTVNLSQGGIRVSMGRRPPLGAAIDVILTLPNGRRLHLPGKVAHLGAGGHDDDVGIRFDDLQPRTGEEISGFITHLRKSGTPPPVPSANGIPTGILIKKTS
jgi:Tfp pilus assembly protein PilZ